MCGRARLIEAGNGHTMLRITGSRAQHTRLCRVHVSAVTTAVPVMAVVAFQVEGAAYIAGENLVFRQVGRVLAQFGEVVGCYLELDLIPLLRPFAQGVGLLADDFNHMFACRSARGILYGWRQYQQRWLLRARDAVMEVVAHAQLAISGLRHARRYQFQRAALDVEARRFCSGIVRYEHGAPGLIGFHAVQESFAPGIGGSHLHQVLDMDGGDNGVTRAELLARCGLNAHAAPMLKYQTLYRLIGEDSSSLRLHDAAQRVGQAAGAALWNGPA